MAALVVLLAVGCSRAESTAPVDTDVDTTPVSRDTTPPTEVPDPTSSQPPDPTTSPLAGKVIVVDAGHNGGNASHSADINKSVFVGNGSKECDTTGTSTNDGYPEYAFTMDVADRLESILEREGATVVMTRSDSSGWGPCVTERAAIGNDAHADLGVSIHGDGGPASGRGFHVLTPALVPGYNDGIIDPSTAFGTVLRDTYRAETGIPTADYIGSDGLMVRSDLGGLNLSRIPKVFIECGNMRNSIDAASMKDPTFRQRAAMAIADSMKSFLANR